MNLREFGLTILGFLSLLWPWTTAKPFVNADVENEMKVNTAFARKSASQLQDYRFEYEPEVKNRLSTFRRGVWGAFWFLVTAVLVALVIAAFWHRTMEAKTLLGAASVFVFAWSTLARLGRRATSFGGNTILERIDIRLLWILYWIGTLLGTL